MKQLLMIPLLILLYSCGENDGSSKIDPDIKPIQLSDNIRKANCVSLTIDEKNKPLISWCETDTATGKKSFFLSWFDDSTGLFHQRIPVPIIQSASIHEEGMPKIAVKGNGTLIAVYETSEPTKENEYAGFLYYIESFDKGNSWTKPRYLDSNSAPGTSHSFASLARLSNGEIGACWLGESTSKTKEGRPVLFAQTQGSKGFGHQITISPSACECCRTAISSNQSSQIAILFRNLLDSSVRDISMSVSNDMGNSFSAPVSFSNDEWMIHGCPHNGPSMISGTKYFYASWFTGGKEPGIHFAKLDANQHVAEKIHLSNKGRFTQLCLLPESLPVVIYNELFMKHDTLCSPLVIEKISGGKVFRKLLTSQNAQASYPVIQPYTDNSMIVAWNESDKIFYKIVNADAISAPAKLPAKNENDSILSLPVKEMHSH